MPRSLLLFCLVIALAVSDIWAGDIATFVDLGFSADGSRYMFGQYGIEAPTLKSWAEIYLVDVRKNDFFPDGIKKTVFPAASSAGQDGSGAFYRLLAENAGLVQKYQIDNLRQGIPLFLNLDDDSPPAAGVETIGFRNFDTGDTYRTTMMSFVEGAGASLCSSFFLSVERTFKDGSVKKYTVGTPGLKRPQVVSYRIRRAFIAPKDGSLIFVVEMRKQAADSVDIRYMVEAFHP